MPELPEVEVMRRKLESNALNAKLIRIDNPDKRLSKKLTKNWEEILLHQNLRETKRIGKYLFLHFGDCYLHLHFGMTGSLEFHPHDQESTKYSRLNLYFDNGIRMDFTDPRTFGKMDIINSVESFANAKKLGKDLLSSVNEDAQKMFLSSKLSLKAILLKQNIVAGIGNWLADEALFRAKLNPKKTGHSLTENEAVELLKITKKIAEEAISVDTHYGDFPANFFTNYRKQDGLCPCSQQAPIEKTTLGGRTTFYCSGCQI
jgi:formamidopyrimidine-DNA glycosylase